MTEILIRKGAAFGSTERWYVPVLAITAFGYPFYAALFAMLGVSGGGLNLIIRAIEVVLLLAAIVMARPSFLGLLGPLAPLIAFFSIYAIRLIYDVLVLDVLMIYQTKMYVLGYFFGLTVLPALTLGLLYRDDHFSVLQRAFFVMILLGNFVVLAYALTGGALNYAGLFAGRTEQMGALEGTATLGPISIGMLGALLCATILGRLASGHRANLSWWIASMALLGVGLANILFGASRGPALGLIAAVLALILRTAFSRRRSEHGASFSRSIAAIALVAAGIFGIASAYEGSIFLFDRFVLLASRGDLGLVEDRDTLYSIALRDFLSSPLVGSSYVLSFDNALPHNVVLEAMIAVGILGLPFFVWSGARFIVGVWRLLGGCNGSGGVAVGLCAVVLGTVGLSSSSISQSPDLWCFVAFTIMSASRSGVWGWRR